LTKGEALRSSRLRNSPPVGGLLQTQIELARRVGGWFRWQGRGGDGFVVKVRQWTKLGEHWPAGPEPVSKEITLQVQSASHLQPLLLLDDIVRLRQPRDCHELIQFSQPLLQKTGTVSIPT